MFKKGDECITVCAGEEVPDEIMRLVMELFTVNFSSHELKNLASPITYRLERAAIQGHILQQVTCDELPMEKNLFSVANPVEAAIHITLSGKRE